MSNLLETGLSLLADKLKAHAGTSIVYSRKVRGEWVPLGAGGTLTATVGRTEFELLDNNDFQIKHESRDYLVQTADLILDGEQVLPEEGDRVTEGSRVFQLTQFGGRPCYAWSDPFHEMLRCHTKQVA